MMCLSRFLLAALPAGLALGCSGPAPSDAGTDAVFVEPSLAPPPAGQGVQLRVEFGVPTGTEQQRCWRFRLDSTAHSEVVRYQVAYNTGSHHMNLFRLSAQSLATGFVPAADTGLSGEGEPCFNAVDFAHYDLVVGSQTETLDWQLPPGVAYRIQAGTQLLLQSHFVNGASQSTPGNRAVVLVNLWTADPATITQHLGTMFANNRGIMLPPRQESQFTARCTLPQASTFVALTGHFHSRGRQFNVSPTNDGVTDLPAIYQSALWSEPPFTKLATPMGIPAGGGLSYTCMYRNDTDFPITFGPHVEYEEHCNLFAYYYPVDPDAPARYCF